MKKIIYSMMFAIVLLAGCTGEKKEAKADTAGQEAFKAFIESVNRTTSNIHSADSLVDPQKAFSSAVTPEIIRDLNLNKSYKLNEKDRMQLEESMDNFFSAIAAQYDTIPGAEAMTDVLKQMKSVVMEKIGETKEIGDIFSEGSPQ